MATTSLQVTMVSASQHLARLFLSPCGILIIKIYGNVSCTSGGPRSNGDRFDIWNLLYIQKEINHYRYVLSTMGMSKESIS